MNVKKLLICYIYIYSCLLKCVNSKFFADKITYNLNLFTKFYLHHKVADLNLHSLFKMVLEVDVVTKLYKSLAQIPALIGARYDLNGLVINSLWSQRNLDTGKLNKFLITHLITQRIKSLGKNNGIDVSQEVLSRSSPSEKFRAVIREIGDKDNRKQLLEIWSHQNIAHTVDLSALELHGDVYTDAEIGGFQWSPDESKVVYIAEKKQQKKEPFYKRKPLKKENSNEESAPSRGEEYSFQQDWGEQLVGKKQSVVAIFELFTENVKILEGIPDDVCPGQVTFAPDGESVVGIALQTEPRKLGLVFCTNRPSHIFQLDFNGNYSILSENGKSVKSPRFTPDGQTVVWLQRNAGGPHHTAMTLVAKQFPFDKSENPRIIVDVVKSSIIINNADTFYGLYNVSFPQRCWASERRLLLSTNQRNTVKSYIVDIDSKSITELKYEEGNLIVLDVYDDLLLCNHQNFLSSDKLLAAQIPHKGNEKSIIFNMITKSTNLPFHDKFKFTYLDLQQESSDSFKSFNAIYVGPKSGDDKSVPLILWPHGGPHSAFTNHLFLELSMFLSLGYAVLLVNFRGSTGNGEDGVKSLLGKVGINDVSDCVLALKTALNQFNWLNPDRVVLTGGSHGGFLVLHLSGQYPDMFKAVVARNPVVDIAAMSVISDIPDWTFVESGLEYTQKGPLNEQELVAMRKLSPIVHAHNVKAPTLLQIGSKDLRVPSLQSTEYYYRLKANGVTVRMNLYEDNHSLSQVPHEMDNIINTILWMDKFINTE